MSSDWEKEFEKEFLRKRDERDRQIAARYDEERRRKAELERSLMSPPVRAFEKIAIEHMQKRGNGST